MQRFFAFGCSYTHYAWPTWANMLSFEYDETYNYGLAGLGNKAIAERIAEAHARHRFTKDDIIIVQWSSHLRNDFWHPYSCRDRPYRWKTSGSVFNYINQKLYDNEWIEKFFYEPAYVMHTLNHVSLVQGFLQGIGCDWYMTSIGDLRNLGSDLRTNADYGETGNIANPLDRGSVKLAWKKIPEFEIYEESIWQKHQDRWLTPMEVHAQKYTDLTYNYYDNTDNGKNIYVDDLHPTPRQHLLWCQAELKDKLKISNDTFTASEEIADIVDEFYKKTKHSKKDFVWGLYTTDLFPEHLGKMKWPMPVIGF